jgi:two-component system catabolic regulation response regulator CreB
MTTIPPMLTKPRILVVEDEPGIVDTLRYVLASDGFEPVCCGTAAEALREFSAAPPALAILDVGLPDASGFELFKRLQELPGGKEVPMLFLTARSDEIDRVVGLELGADDYVAKPFSPRELVARVRARLRRGEPAAGVREHGDFAHDPAGQRIRLRGQWLALTRYEYLLLAALLARPGAILSRERLMDEVWGDAPDTVDRTVDTHVKTLRAKLRVAAPDADPIRTHRGLGYSLETGG